MKIQILGWAVVSKKKHAYFRIKGDPMVPGADVLPIFNISSFGIKFVTDGIHWVLLDDVDSYFVINEDSPLLGGVAAQIIPSMIGNASCSATDLLEIINTITKNWRQENENQNRLRK